ncbi:TadE family type IV pilus minor pilin [Streptomyces polygonati]|uniref:TadE family type IV pilus minor pilin n=1 Tax=Streptomyces polygonati TaxID=1617087 RepID=A0ABV8HUL5_9ACTN
MCRSERAGPPGRGEDGYVTAEAAVVIPTLVALAAFLVWGLMAGAAQLRCVDAARAGARAAARSETAADVLRVARAAAPAGAEVSVGRDGDLVRVKVAVPMPRFPVALAAEAAALDESAVERAGGGGGP